MGVNWFADMSDQEVEEKIIGGIKRKSQSGDIRPFTVEEVEREEAKYSQNGKKHKIRVGASLES